MEINASVPTGQGAISVGATDKMSAISGDDFMKILIKQLQMQDPLKPMDNQQMVQQMSTIRELEMNTRMSKKLEQLTDQQRFGAAAALIGKHVKGTVADEDGKEFTMEGTVKSVRFTDKGEAILELDSGEALPLTKLEEVWDAQGNPITVNASANRAAGQNAAAA